MIVIQVSHQNVETAWKALDGLAVPRRQISYEEANRFERMWNIRTWPGAIVLNERRYRGRRPAGEVAGSSFLGAGVKGRATQARDRGSIQLKVLRQALPRTTIQAGTGGGWVGGVP